MYFGRFCAGAEAEILRSIIFNKRGIQSGFKAQRTEFRRHKDFVRNLTRACEATSALLLPHGDAPPDLSSNEVQLGRSTRTIEALFSNDLMI